MRSIVCLMLLAVTWEPVSAAEIEWLGTLTVSGTERDLSGLDGQLPDGTPLDQLGGWSAIEYLGGNTYVLLPDRGPLDGAVPYPCRLQFAEIQLCPGESPALSFRLTKTVFLQDRNGVGFVGLAAQDGQTSERLDPEGIRLVQAKPLQFLISDEYGPHLIRFDEAGRELGRLAIPAHCLPTAIRPEQSVAVETVLFGRQDNGGLEGLAVTPQRDFAWGIFQRPLLQDHALDGEQRVGQNCRILKISLSGTNLETEEFVYQLDHPGVGISEILAVNDHQFLVLERDGRIGPLAKHKRIYLADAQAATNVSDVPELPAATLPNPIRPLTKEVLVDFLAPGSPYTPDSIPEKFEGLTFGPPLPDGRTLLLVTVDNDFESQQPSQLIAFALRWSL